MTEGAVEPRRGLEGGEELGLRDDLPHPRLEPRDRELGGGPPHGGGGLAKHNFLRMKTSPFEVCMSMYLVESLPNDDPSIWCVITDIL